MGSVYQGWMLALLVAAIGTLGTVHLLLSQFRQLALDIPNHRSLHQVPVPRTGGWAIWVGVALALVVSPLALRWEIALPFGGLLMVSLIDDLHPLSAKVRFIVQTLAVGSLLYFLVPDLPAWLLPVLLVGGVWVVNLYNFMDGMDGFAGSMTVIGFFTLAGISFFRGDISLAGICLLVGISTLIFLYYNFPVAKLFLGDAGSTVIGLIVFAVSVQGWSGQVFSPLVPLLVFAPFWLDATWTLICRVWAGEPWWQAHRQHYYQRSALRVGVKKTLILEVFVMAGMSLLAVTLVISGKL